MEKKQSSREISVNIIISVLEEEKLSHIVLRKALSEFGNTKEDNVEKAFITRLVQGTIEKKITIDYIIDSFSKIKTAKMKPFIRNLLRMSVYQIMYMDTVPDSAVCNEAVKLAKKRGFVNLSSFVNGILRNISRNKENMGRHRAPLHERVYYGTTFRYRNRTGCENASHYRYCRKTRH
jgi:16S rRNA (cytosine967-C5)-methyltransferase